MHRMNSEQVTVSKSLVRGLRESLGLSTTELAYRLGVNQSSVVRLEQSEIKGSISLSLLQRALDAMGYGLQFTLVPLRKESDRPKKRDKAAKGFRLGRAKKSAVAGDLDAEALAAIDLLTPEQRLKRSLELSDFTRGMKRCLKKP